jgi:hypothetical protein
MKLNPSNPPEHRIVRRIRGSYLHMEEWYSLCSRHREHQTLCIACNHGSWVNIYKHWFGSVVFHISPRLWMWWANRDRKEFVGTHD